MVHENPPGKDEVPHAPGKDDDSKNKRVPWNGKCTYCGAVQPTMYSPIPWLYDKEKNPVKIAHMQTNCVECGVITHLFPEGRHRSR